MRLGNVLEDALGLRRVAQVLVRMVLPRKLAVRLFDLGRRRRVAQPKYGVVVRDRLVVV
jgi:hypothetical protein